MSQTVISVRDLGKTYHVPEREGGMKAALTSLFKRRTRDVEAVKNVSFTIDAGEIVGFLGPNGAGKTTTLKMLAGLLYPTSGTATVHDFVPWDRDSAYLSRMALIMGQRNQLTWDVPVLDSFLLNKAIFRIQDDDYRTRVTELLDLLDLHDVVRKPVRNLSLGERMKCEFAGSLLHQPSVLFLDEPTIGLDVAMQRRIRSFVEDYNRRTGASIMLTSHYMADVEALCQRVIVIHHGTTLYDGNLPGLVARFSPLKTIAVEFESEVSEQHLQDFANDHQVTLDRTETGATIRAAKEATARVTARLLEAFPVSDLTVEEPPIEEVIEHVFATTRSDLAT